MALEDEVHHHLWCVSNIRKHFNMGMSINRRGMPNASSSKEQYSFSISNLHSPALKFDEPKWFATVTSMAGRDWFMHLLVVLHKFNSTVLCYCTHSRPFRIILSICPLSGFDIKFVLSAIFSKLRAIQSVTTVLGKVTTFISVAADFLLNCVPKICGRTVHRYNNCAFSGGCYQLEKNLRW